MQNVVFCYYPLVTHERLNIGNMNDNGLFAINQQNKALVGGAFGVEPTQ